MSGLRQAIYDIVEERHMTIEQVKETIEESLFAAYKRRYGVDDNAVVTISEDLESVTLASRKSVVDEAEDDLDPVHEISLAKAKELDARAEEGDEILIPVDIGHLNRGCVQSGKQKAQQTIKDIQKNRIYNEYKKKEGDIVIGNFQSETEGGYLIDLGNTHGILPFRNQSQRDSYSKGDKIKCLVESVAPDERNPRLLRITLSRTSEKFVERLFEQYIPELKPENRQIGIAKIVREPGERTKVAVYPIQSGIDPVGTCVGLGGQRIRNIITELNGELIDVVKWDSNPMVYIKNALSPAKVSEVYIVDEKKKSAIALVEDDQLSFAIGKHGYNVRLVNRLCDWMVDVKTKEQFAEMDVSKNARQAADQLFGFAEEEGGAPAFEEAGVTAEAAGPAAPEEAAEEEEELMLDELPIPEALLRKLNFYDIYSVEEYIELKEEDFKEMDKLSEEDIAKVGQIISENVDIVREGDEEFEYHCPNCGAALTPEMTECPSCHAVLSFE